LAAAAAAVSALVAAAPREPVVPVPARLLVLAHLQVPAQRPREAELPAPAQLQVVLVVPALGLAHLVVGPVAAVERLLRLSPQSFSAAMARSSP
jgi:hypothetical protein